MESTFISQSEKYLYEMPMEDLKARAQELLEKITSGVY